MNQRASVTELFSEDELRRLVVADEHVVPSGIACLTVAEPGIVGKYAGIPITKHAMKLPINSIEKLKELFKLGKIEFPKINPGWFGGLKEWE